MKALAVCVLQTWDLRHPVTLSHPGPFFKPLKGSGPFLHLPSSTNPFPRVSCRASETNPCFNPNIPSLELRLPVSRVLKAPDLKKRNLLTSANMGQLFEVGTFQPNQVMLTPLIFFGGLPSNIRPPEWSRACPWRPHYYPRRPPPHLGGCATKNCFAFCA